MEKLALNRQQRVVAFAGYAVLLALLQLLITGKVFHVDTWDLNALLINGLALFAFHLFDAPFFRTPSDSFPNSLGAGISLLAASTAVSPSLSNIVVGTRWVGICLTATVFMASVAAIWFDRRKAGTPKAQQYFDVAGYRVSADLGRGEVLFSFPFVVSTLSNYGENSSSMTWLLVAWFLVITVKPVETFIRLAQSLSAIRAGNTASDAIGVILRVDHPGLVRVHLDPKADWSRNHTIVGHLADGRKTRLLPIGTHLQNDRLVGTALIDAGATPALPGVLPGQVVMLPQSSLKTEEYGSGVVDGGDVVGIVCEDSRIDLLRFEVLVGSFIKEGEIVTTVGPSGPVFYQVIGGKTEEENFEGDPRGRTIATAVQLGILAGPNFRKNAWLPCMNEQVHRPVKVVASSAHEESVEGMQLGVVAGTDIQVHMSLNEAITHHTAILGMTGKGKTEVALDIIRHANLHGVKVFCVDFTGEYGARLSDTNPVPLGLDENRAEELDGKLFAADTGAYGAGEEKKALRAFSEATTADIKIAVDKFLRPPGGSVGIFELPKITNSKATLRATEMYLSSIMEWAKTHRRARRILIVLEEAHTIIPEHFGSGFDYDTQWIVGRISQIALQGRKYGVGLLLLSQRTALVSKSVLSQCNTYITFGLVDKTSLDYLANIYSGDHVALIPSLDQRQALVFGKAFNCDRPILIEIPFEQKKFDASEALSINLPEAAGQAAELSVEGAMAMHESGIPPEAKL
ncbi:ATP-binding protein [bacterium]|nr:ATP-binding protein [bacterium]